jgi:hypothetical protein
VAGVVPVTAGSELVGPELDVVEAAGCFGLTRKIAVAVRTSTATAAPTAITISRVRRGARYGVVDFRLVGVIASGSYR